MFVGSGPSIVKVEQQLSFCILDKWIYFISVFLITQLFMLLLLRRGTVAITAVGYGLLTSEERRQTLQIGVVDTCT
jgi:hypothetical protein